ncbi:hypothetical protein [Streptomyces sp. NPDC054838]
MKLARRIVAVPVAAVAAVLLTAGTAAADGELLSLLDGPSVAVGCFPAGQVGVGNTFSGTQNEQCSQSATQTNPATPGNNGATGREVVDNTVSVNPGENMQVDAVCPAGKVATGGGFNTSGPQMEIEASVPLSAPDQGWRVIAFNMSTTSLPLTAFVVCVNGTAS